jgi:hypothetical protein
MSAPEAKRRRTELQLFPAVPGFTAEPRRDGDMTAANASVSGCIPASDRGYNDITVTKPTGRSTYDSLQVQLTRRFTGDFEMAGSYTWARGYQNTLRQTLPSSMDRTDVQEHVMVISYMYAVPSASAVLGGNRVVSAVLDNWRLSGISTFATGGRGNVGVTYSPAFDFTGGGEGCTGSNGSTSGNVYNVVGDPTLPKDERSIDRWFNTDAFKPASGRGDQGNMARATRGSSGCPATTTTTCRCSRTSGSGSRPSSIAGKSTTCSTACSSRPSTRQPSSTRPPARRPTATSAG